MMHLYIKSLTNIHLTWKEFSTADCMEFLHLFLTLQNIIINKQLLKVIVCCLKQVKVVATFTIKLFLVVKFTHFIWNPSD